MTSEEEARAAQLVEQRLDAQSYRVELDAMYPLRGPRQILSPAYAVIIREGKINSHLPYRGQAWNVPYGGGKVLTFEDEILQYREYADGDKRVVDLVVDNEEDVLRYVFEFHANGKAYLTVSARHRESISYSGILNPDFDPADPKK